MEVAALEAEVLARAAAAGWPLWRFEDVSVAVGPLFAHVRSGRVISWGIEPLGDVLIAADGKVSDFAERVQRRVRRSTAALAATATAAAFGAGALGTTAVLCSRRRTA